MKKLCVLLILAWTACAGASGGRQADRPLNGEWDFQPVKAWEVDCAGDHPFQTPAELRVSENETLFFRDFGRNLSCIFDRDGSFIASFAAAGDGPGELSRYINCFVVGEMVVIAEPDKLNYHTRQGRFIRSAPNNLFQRFPRVFLNENEFLFVPEGPGVSPEDKGTVMRADLASGETAPFLEFTPSSAPHRTGPPVVIRGMTPAVEMARDATTGAFYFGHSGAYVIHAADATGRVLHSFGLQREPMTIGAEAKRRHFEDLGWPPQRIEHVLPNLPDALAAFTRIQANDGLVYVWATTDLGRRQDHLQIDIFSPDGTYLYKATVRFSDDGSRRSHPENVAIGGHHLFAILTDESGKSTLVRYDLTLPGRPSGAKAQTGRSSEKHGARVGTP